MVAVSELAELPLEGCTPRLSVLSLHTSPLAQPGKGDSGGMNVYAVDIEEVLQRHPAVAEATVIGIPSKRWGESPVGLVVLKSGSEAQSTEALQQWANDQLGPSQRLAMIELRDGLPKNHLGKIFKMQLRQELQDALGTLD